MQLVKSLICVLETQMTVHLVQLWVLKEGIHTFLCSVVIVKPQRSAVVNTVVKRKVVSILEFVAQFKNNNTCLTIRCCVKIWTASALQPVAFWNVFTQIDDEVDSRPHWPCWYVVCLCICSVSETELVNLSKRLIGSSVSDTESISVASACQQLRQYLSFNYHDASLLQQCRWSTWSSYCLTWCILRVTEHLMTHYFRNLWGHQYNQTQHFAMWHFNSLLLLTLLPQLIHAQYISDVGL
jgi:hypothetical protein